LSTIEMLHLVAGDYYYFSIGNRLIRTSPTILFFTRRVLVGSHLDSRGDVIPRRCGQMPTLVHRTDVRGAAGSFGLA